MDKKKDRGLVEMTVAEAASLIVALPADISSMMWGPPGAGKTFTIHDAFETQGYEVIDVLAGCSEPTDFTGIPFAWEDKAAKYLPPHWAYRCGTGAPERDQGPKVLFFDDVVTAHEQTQAALYKLFHERRVGEVQLRDNVRLIAAGNREEDKSAVTEMPMALGNRMAHFYIKVDTDVWLDWARKNGVNPHITAFIRRQPQRITNFAEAVEHGDKAFATPRTWHMLSRAISALQENGGLGKNLFKISAGIIGSGTAAEFQTFVKTTSKLIPPEVIVESPQTAKVYGNEQIDLSYATVSALEHFITQKKNHKYWKAALQYALRLSAEMGILIAKHTSEVVMNQLPQAERQKAASSKELKEMFKTWGEFIVPLS